MEGSRRQQLLASSKGCVISGLQALTWVSLPLHLIPDLTMHAQAPLLFTCLPLREAEDCRLFKRLHEAESGLQLLIVEKCSARIVIAILARMSLSLALQASCCGHAIANAEDAMHSTWKVALLRRCL